MLVSIKRVLIFGAAAMLIPASLIAVDGAQTTVNARVLPGGVQRSSDLSVALNGHAGPVSSVAFAPRGRTLATATENGTVQLWDVQRGTRLGTLTGLTRIVDSVAFSPQGSILAAGARKGVVLLWDLRTHKRRGSALKALAGSVYSVAFSPDGRLLAAGSANGTVVLWDVRSHSRLERSTLTPAPSPVSRSVLAAYSPLPT